jgi:hypothetical protein
MLKRRSDPRNWNVRAFAMLLKCKQERDEGVQRGSGEQVVYCGVWLECCSAQFI